MPTVSSHSVTVSTAAVTQAAADIIATTRRPLWAVVKANGYGLGAKRVAAAVADIAEGYYVFHVKEAIDADLASFGKPVLALIHPPELPAIDDLIALNVRPIVSSIELAAHYRKARPVLIVDTGQQRFSCPPDDVDIALAEGEIDTAITHASTYAQVQKFSGLCGARGLSLQAAGTSLLGDNRCWLDGVRPGLALYEHALTVRASLVEVRVSRGPAGYSGFVLPRFGLIMIGYSHGLRRGPCLINGRLQQVVEVGMQSSFVSVDPTDAAGDQVSLLGDGLSPRVVAEAWKCSPQEVLYRLATGA